MELRLPETALTPSQECLLHTIQNFIDMDKLDLKTHQMRCFLGPHTRHDVVIKELAACNDNVWPLVPNFNAASRQGYNKFIHPKSAPSELAKIADGFVCLTTATERYSEKFLYQMIAYQPAAIFHLGG